MLHLLNQQYSFAKCSTELPPARLQVLESYEELRKEVASGCEQVETLRVKMRALEANLVDKSLRLPVLVRRECLHDHFACVDPKHKTLYVPCEYALITLRGIRSSWWMVQAVQTRWHCSRSCDSCMQSGQHSQQYSSFSVHAISLARLI